jgi:hypothetical protein
MRKMFLDTVQPHAQKSSLSPKIDFQGAEGWTTAKNVDTKIAMASALTAG